MPPRDEIIPTLVIRRFLREAPIKYEFVVWKNEKKERQASSSFSVEAFSGEKKNAIIKEEGDEKEESAEVPASGRQQQEIKKIMRRNGGRLVVGRLKKQKSIKKSGVFASKQAAVLYKIYVPGTNNEKLGEA
jgi:hypothetical protein